MWQVLQAQDPNIITITDSPHLSPLKRPAPPANVPTVTNIDIDAGSSSFIETDGNRNTKQLSIEEEFFQYTNTMKGPNTKVRIELNKLHFKLSLLQVLPVRDFFNRLPEELVLSVFKWLPKCTLAKCARGSDNKSVTVTHSSCFSLQAVAEGNPGRVSMAPPRPRPRHSSRRRGGSGQSSPQYFIRFQLSWWE